MFFQKFAILAVFSLLLAGEIRTTAQAQAVAFAGKPFGVAKVTVPFTQADFGEPIDSRAFTISDTSGRVFYPVFEPKRILPILQSLMGADQVTPPQSLDVHFLFVGEEPFDIAINSPTPHTVRIQPSFGRNDRQHQASLRRWWQSYHRVIRDKAQGMQHLPVMETYLSMMLSNRFQLPPPILSQKESSDRDALAPNRSLMLLLGTDKVHEAMLKSIMNNEVVASRPDHPISPPIQWPELLVPDSHRDGEVEAISKYVPQECFYVRFGSLSNYLWLNDLLKRNGGDLANLVSSRRVALHLTEGLQRQLALKQSELARLFGDSVVKDVALIGRDTYTREGAAMGMLFQAKQSDVLANDINQNRKAAVARFKDQGATLQAIQISGKAVSFLSTPDNRLRSYYVQRGDFHLVTTSRSIAQRFIELETQPTSLANSPAFQHARALMPLNRNDTIFVYLSTEFFRELYSPTYRVELRRRLQSVVEMELFQLAQAAAQNEGLGYLSEEELVSTGFLPSKFGQRADGSQIVIGEDSLADSIRGGRGHFIPIADVDIQAMTEQEANDFEQLRQFHHSQWQQMNPVLAGIHRFKLNDEGLERVSLDLRMSPFQRSNYSQFVSMLGPPLNNRIVPHPTDFAHVQAVLDSNMTEGLTHYAIGVQDLPFPLQDFRNQGLLSTIRMLKATPGYLAAWPKPGIIDNIPLLGSMATPDAYGYSQLPFGLWRREINAFSALSFHPDILGEVTPTLRIEEDPYPAQVRIHIGDVSNAQITPFANGLAKAWAEEGSLENAALFHEVHNQFGIPLAESKAFAEQLLNLEFIDPLGGEYQFVTQAPGPGRWASTSWAITDSNYEANFMEWFRGLDARLNVGDSLLELHAQIDMQSPKPEPQLSLPTFDLFGLGNAFGGAKKPAEATRPAEPKAEEVGGEALPIPQPTQPSGGGTQF